MKNWKFNYKKGDWIAYVAIAFIMYFAMLVVKYLTTVTNVNPFRLW